MSPKSWLNSTLLLLSAFVGFPSGSKGKKSACSEGNLALIPGLGRSLRGNGLPTLVFWPGEFHGQRSLVGYSPWGHKKSDTTEWLSLSAFLTLLWRQTLHLWTHTPVLWGSLSKGKKTLSTHAGWRREPETSQEQEVSRDKCADGASTKSKDQSLPATYQILTGIHHVILLSFSFYGYWECWEKEDYLKIFIFCFLLNFLFCIGVQPINNAVTVSGEQRRDSATHMRVSVLPHTPLPARLPHCLEQSSMCYTAGPCWLPILNTAVCTCPSQTPELPLPAGNHKLIFCESLSVL